MRYEIVVAGGMESMTQAPHLLPKSREGFKYGDTTLVDSMAYDALWDQATAQAMGMLTEQCNAAAANLTREEQDAFAARSHQRAAEAWKNGVFDDEVVPVTVKTRGGRRCRSPPTRASAATPPSSRWPSCARRSARTAPSPPAPPPRSPTARARSW